MTYNKVIKKPIIKAHQIRHIHIIKVKMKSQSYLRKYNIEGWIKCYILTKIQE